MKTFTDSLVFKFFAVTLSILLSAPSAFAGDIGKVTYTEGRVDIYRAGSSAAAPLRADDVISVGDSIRTKSASKAEIAFSDNTVVRVAQNSKVDINDYQLDENNKRKTATITLERGKARAIIAKMQDKAEFNINTPNAKGTVRGSDVCAFYSAGNSGMLVSEGKLSIASVAHPEDIVLIPAGNSVLVPLEESPKGPRPYLELEKTLHETDTDVPVIMKREGETVIRGMVSKFSGDVKVTRKDEAAPREVKVGDVLKDGDRITTGSNGMVEIRFDNGNAMNLKPNTDILIVKLSMDPRTGEYENLFESNMGQIKARIEGLKGKSKFEIKSPTAISGARGTIMYMNISPGKVHVFFEGGNGYLNNIASSVETTVHAGYNASADGQGGTSTPAPTSDVDRESWGGGWDPGSGVEGYSAPEGSTGTYLYSDDTGTVTILGTGSTEEPSGEFQEFFSDVPQEEGQGGSSGETGGEEEIVTTSDGFVNGSLGTFEMDNGSFQGVFGLVGSFWNNATATLAAAGSFDTLGYEPFVWTGEMGSYNPITMQYLTSDGGAFYGITGGIGGINENDVLDGFARLLYIDADGNAGVAGGDLSGIYSLDPEGFVLTGHLTGSEYVNGIDVAPGDLYDSIYQTPNDAGTLEGYFSDGEGYISGHDDFMTMSIVNYETGNAQGWGIYGQYISGEYYNAYDDTYFSAIMGGNDAFGAYKYEYYGEWGLNDDYGYWIANANSVDRDDIFGWDSESHTLYGSLDGYFMTRTKMGMINGLFIGNFTDDGDGYGSWEAIGAGEWEGTPLTFSGEVGMDESNLYSNYEGQAVEVGSMNGLVGGTSSPWYGPASFTMMGEYGYDGNSPDMFNSTIFSYNAIQDNGTTIDGGGFYGYSAGILLDGIIKGIAAALYVDPLGNAGTLSGRLSGGYYSGIDMWMADGVFVPTLMVPGGEYGFDIYDMYDIITDDLSAMMAGNFGDSDLGYRISGQTISGATAAIDGQNWGVYTLTFGAENDNDYNNAGGYKTWYGDMIGYGSFASGQYSLGVLRGDILGTYYEADAATTSGYWIASSVGTWSEYYNDGYGYEGDSVFYALTGGIWYEDCMIGKMIGIYGTPDMFEYLEESQTDLTDSYGAFDDGGEMTLDYFDGVSVHMPGNDWAIWGARIGGTYSDPTPIFKILMYGTGSFDGDVDTYWFGVSVGTKAPNSSVMNGFFRGLTYQFSEGDTIVSLVKGDMLGVLKDDDTWESVTLGDVIFKGYTEITPDGEEDFMNYIMGENFTGRGIGRFDNGGSMDVTYLDGSTFNIEDQGWGIWMTTMGGTCSGDLGSTFRVAVGGSTDGENSKAMLGNVTGSRESDSLIGSFKGIWLAQGGEDSIFAGTFSGDVAGYIDVDAPGTWNAVSAGEWVEVTDILNEHTMFGEMGMSTINDYISMPITEVYSNVMSGAGSFAAGGNISAVMDMSMYALSATAMQGIWTSIINGTYSGDTGNAWNATVNNGADTVTLTGTSWDNGQWAAEVSGTVGGNNITNGQAGGTYGDGTFTGVGAGTWEQPTPPTP